jgi:hypothetical protein
MPISQETRAAAADRLVALHGPEQAERSERGVRQVAERWWAEDGDDAAFTAFCEGRFEPKAEALGAAFARLQSTFEQMEGRVHEIRREVTFPIDCDTGPLSPLDELFSEIDLGPQLDESYFRSKLAFYALLNFPVHSLDERLRDGASWDREAWARSRMMDRFAQRIPAAVAQQLNRTFLAVDQYIAAYNIRADRLLTPGYEAPLFPEGLKLISHWALRDQLASCYGDDDRTLALARQRTIYQVMERIVRQEIPRAVIGNADLYWDPFANTVRPVAGGESAPGLAEREPDTRYEWLLKVFRSARQLDAYSPEAPTYVARRFNLDREIPEAEVEALLISVLESPEARELGRYIADRLGRPLEPFDLWYSGFKSRAGFGGDELDKVVQGRYPNLAAFARGLPDLLERMGFTPERARFISDHIEVDPARGAGHALQAVRREDKAHLRTRVPAGGMNFQGYNTAMHELGHNTEEVFSLNGIDHWWLYGVPNTAFTEAFAFVFQERDLELLGLATGEDRRLAQALAVLWNTYEIGGVSLVDMRIWNWMYAHPEATPAELREATLTIARDVWNRYYQPVFGPADREILAIYSHMISSGLYLPDYAIGHIISFQVAEQIRKESFGPEVERMTRLGRLTPEAWMREAVGGPISAGALLRAAKEAMEGVAA